MKVNIHWFRQDLRLSDNPSLFEASNTGKVLPIYILDDKNSVKHKIGSASRFWLYHSLRKLNQSLNGKLSIYVGNPEIIIHDIAKRHNAKAVYWNRCYEPWQIQRDKKINEALKENNIETYSYNGSLLWEPWEVLKKDKTPYKVFTPFYRKGCLNNKPPREPIPKPEKLSLIDNFSNSINIDQLKLLPIKDWDKKLEAHWNIGEEAAKKKLYEFIDTGINDYKEGRNFPARKNVSQLSPYLHFGELSPNQIWSAVRILEEDNNTDHFCSELGWREFSYNLLYNFPDLPTKNLNSKFDRFPWQDDDIKLKSWQKGQTGIPIVDAGMRELWQTGYMHNRVRMIVGSFLVKNLLLHWKHGESWFWDCLVDADLANNSASWQWIAGCGADAAPYFRIFNPVLQGQKFDPDGEYTRRYIPELNNLPDKYLFNPWDAPDEVLERANIKIGKTYPKPIVNLKQSRERALAAFSLMKEALLT